MSVLELDNCWKTQRKFKKKGRTGEKYENGAESGVSKEVQSSSWEIQELHKGRTWRMMMVMVRMV